MNILTWLVIIPLLTITGILLVKDARQAKIVSAIGMGIQLIVSVSHRLPVPGGAEGRQHRSRCSW